MFKNCKTKQSIARQKQIENCFLQMLKLRFYEDITVSEICDELNMPRKAFYRYFSCKEGLLQALIKHNLESYQDYYKSFNVSSRTIKGELSYYFGFWKTEPIKTMLDVLDKNSLLGHLFKFSREMSSSSFINMEKFFPSETPWHREQILNFTIQGLQSLMLDWYYSGFEKSTDEMAKVACIMLQEPLFPNLEKYGIAKN